LFDLKDDSTNKDNIIYAAAFGALIFGLHPVQVETVSWITGLKGVLSGFFSLGAIYLYLLYYASKKNLFVYGASTGMLILAMLAMPSAVAVPVILFFLMLWVDHRIIGRAVYPLVLWVSLALITVMLTRIAQPIEGGAVFYPWQVRPLVALDAVMFYVYKVFWPYVLTVDYGRTPAYVVGLSWRNPYLLLVLFAAGLVYRFRHRKQWLALGCAFVAGILPVSGLLPFAHQETSTVADRYLYLSMVVIAVASAAIIVGKMRLPVISLCILLVVMSGGRSFYQCSHWKNTESIMGYTLQHYPRSFRANLDYGIALMSRGR